MAGCDIKTLQGKRRAQRYPTRFFATIIFARRSFTIEIADISRVGACARGVGLPPRGVDVVLIAQGLEVAATVVWSDGRACGMNFHEPIEPLAVVRGNPFLSARRPLARAEQMRV